MKKKLLLGAIALSSLVNSADAQIAKSWNKEIKNRLFFSLKNLPHSDSLNRANFCHNILSKSQDVADFEQIWTTWYFIVELKHPENAKAIIEKLKKEGVVVKYDEELKNLTCTTPLFAASDPWNDMWYWNSLNQNVLKEKQLMDSIFYLIKANYWNGTNDAWENVWLSMGEIRNGSHTDMSAYNATWSFDYYRNQTVNFSNATLHGSQTAWVAAAKINNGLDMVWMWNIKWVKIKNFGIDENTSSKAAILAAMQACIDEANNTWERQILSISTAITTGVDVDFDNMFNLADANGKVIFVLWAWNDGNAIWQTLSNPHSSVITVQWWDGTWNKASFSSYNAEVSFKATWMRWLNQTGTTGTNAWQGTSAAAPWVAWGIRLLWNLNPNWTPADINTMVKDYKNAKAIITNPSSTQTPTVSFWYLIQNLHFDIVHDYPTVINASTTPTINLTTSTHDIQTGTISNPTYWYQKNQTWAWIQNPAWIMDLNAAGNGTHNVKIEFDIAHQPGKCTEIIRQIQVSNATVPTTPPIPDIRNVDAIECASNGTQIGKLQNPPLAPATIAVTQDGNPLTYNPSDSTFQYPVWAAWAHTIRAKYTNTAGSSQKDTLYNVNAAIATSISAPTASANAICAGQSSTLTAIYANMGTNPTFQWYRNTNPISWATSPTYNYTNAAVGTQGFYVVITRDPNGCYTSGSPVASTSPVTNVTVSATPNAPIDNVVQPTCTVATGSITVTNWQAWDQFSFNNGLTWQTSNVATWLAAWTYQVLIKNSGWCISSSTAEVINAQPATPSAPVDNVVQPTCTVATGTITVTNGQAGDQFSFNNGVTWQSSNVASGLTAWTYQVLRKNTAGCISAATAEVINAQPATPSAPVDNVVQPTCAVSTGSITVTNGQAWDQFSFNNGVTWQSSNVATGLAAGTYQVLRKNTAGCISAATTEVITAAPWTPSAPVNSVVQPTCTVSTGTITVTNGQAWDQFSFNNGVTWQTSNVATGLAAGTYQVLRKNTAGCISAATAQVINTQPVTPATPIDNVVQPTCTVATGSITVTNGQAWDQFSFNNGLTWQTSNVASGLAAWTYQVLVKSSGGCISPVKAEVINGAPSTPNAPATSVVQPTCAVSTGTITVTNWQAWDQFSFNNGVTWQTSNVATGLAAGTYQVLRKNTAGCISSATAEVITAAPNAPVVWAITQVNNTISVPTIAGATYQWQFSASASGPFTVVSWATTNSYTITQSWYYKLVVTWSNGCTGESNAFNAIITWTNPNPNTSNGDLRLFPNPIQNWQKLTIDSLPQLLTEVTIVIYDNTGRRVNVMVVPVANRKAQFQLPFLSSGLYLLRIQDKKNNKRYDGEKIIVSGN